MSSRPSAQSATEPASASGPLLQCQGVSRWFAAAGGVVYAVRDVSLTVHRGESVAITGRSGSGKSTLLNLIAGLDVPSEGSILFEGEDLAGLSDAQLTRLRRDRVGLVFQFFNLLSTLSVRENVMLPGLLARRNPDWVREQAESLLRAVDLLHRANATPETLSGGEMQRCAVARALVLAPRLLLADEPTGNLDSRSADQVMDLLTSVPRERGASLLLVTHSPELAMRADRRLVMADGRLAEG